MFPDPFGSATSWFKTILFHRYNETFFSDFGLPTFRKNEVEKFDEEEDVKQRMSKVYQAPESHDYDRITQAVDVYAYSIILVEIATRNDPYGASIASLNPF